jgi:DNA repair protein RadC
MSLRIHDLPESDRPRERLIEQGAESLSNAELLAIFINTGLKGENAIQVGTRLLKEYKNLRTLSRRTAKELSKDRGLGPAKAAHIAAAFELGRRATEEKIVEQRMDEPQLVCDLLQAGMAQLNQEVLHLLVLNTRMKLVHHEKELTKGTANESVAHPRDIIGCALKHNAHAFILAHNHPSGDPSPSEADRQLTRRIRDAAELMKIIFADHVIIGAPRPGGKAYFSFREAGML